MMIPIVTIDLKVKNTLINNSWVKEDIIMEIEYWEKKWLFFFLVEEAFLEYMVLSFTHSSRNDSLLKKTQKNW